jgi:hypothetical protein
MIDKTKSTVQISRLMAGPCKCGRMGKTSRIKYLECIVRCTNVTVVDTELPPTMLQSRNVADDGATQNVKE